MHNFGEFCTIQDNQLETMLAWRNAPAVRANMYTRHEIALAEHLSWWQRTLQQEDQQHFLYQSQDTALGIVSFTCIDRKNSNCSWAFYSSPDAPKGTGSCMEFLALEHVFEQLKLHKLYCEVLAFNTPVIKLHEKFGFKIEGIFRQQHLHDNEYIDIYRLGINRTDWENKRTEMLATLSRARKVRDAQHDRN